MEGTEKLYYSSLSSKIVKGTYNILSLVKDRLSQALMRSTTPMLSSLSPETKIYIRRFSEKT